MTNPVHMWPYWREKHGVETALTDYYLDRLVTNVRLQSALTQIEGAKMVIEAEFKKLVDAESDDFD